MKFFTPILIISCIIALAAGFSVGGLAAMGKSQVSSMMNTAAKTAQTATSSLGTLPQLPLNITMPTTLNLPLLKMMKQQFTKFQNQIAAGQATIAKMMKAATGSGVNATASEEE